MRKIFSIIFPALFLISTIAFAFKVQDDPICEDPLHVGYRYSGIGTPPLEFDPDDLPTNLENIGEYGPDFDCSEPPTNVCHWVFVEATESSPAQWIPCEDGGYKDLRDN